MLFHIPTKFLWVDSSIETPFWYVYWFLLFVSGLFNRRNEFPTRNVVFSPQFFVSLIFRWVDIFSLVMTFTGLHYNRKIPENDELAFCKSNYVFLLLFTRTSTILSRDSNAVGKILSVTFLRGCIQEMLLRTSTFVFWKHREMHVMYNNTAM